MRSIPKLRISVNFLTLLSLIGQALAFLLVSASRIFLDWVPQFKDTPLTQLVAAEASYAAAGVMFFVLLIWTMYLQATYRIALEVILATMGLMLVSLFVIIWGFLSGWSLVGVSLALLFWLIQAYSLFFVGRLLVKILFYAKNN